MDAKQTALQEKLRKLLKEAADVGAQIQAIEQGPGTPHYDQIESHAHEIGQQLSQLMQQTRERPVNRILLWGRFYISGRRWLRVQ